MRFFNGTTLKLTYVLAAGPDPDTTVNTYLTFPGVGSPRSAYVGLKGSSPNMDWPQGATVVPFPYGPTLGNNLLTDSLGDEYGIRSWSITAEPGHIGGKLQIAYYLFSNFDQTAPDATDDITLGPGSWDTGPLFVYTGTFSDPYYRIPYFRFIPGPLIIPLGV